MKKLGRMMLAAALILAPGGCAAIDYRPDADRAVYLAAKDAAYCLWRFGAVSPAELERAVPYLEAIEALLSAADEAQLDAVVGEFLLGEIEGRADPRDREILKELVTAALEDLELESPAIAEDRRVKTARLVVGGILDGIAYATEAAGGAHGE